tara:strand:- start:369908 stop:371062 length:1155 start_codon:yes stop_codon:yes gene_type:complete
MSESANNLHALRRELNVLAYLGLALLVVFSVFFLYFWPLLQVTVLLIQSAIIWLFCIYRALGFMALNRLDDNSPNYADLGWANRLSLLRGWLIALTAGFIFQPGLSENIIVFPALAYLIAAVIDRIDGYIARITKHQSLLGSRLDTEFDALGLLIAPLLAVWLGQIHWSYLSVSLAYYLFQWGQYRRLRNSRPVFPLAANPERRAVAGFQMGFLAVILWPILEPPATTIAGFAFMLPLLVGFLIDWLTVSGRINRGSSDTNNLLLEAYKLIQQLLLPLGRILIGLLLGLSFYRKDIFSTDSIITTGIGLLVILCALMILAGMAGRVFALIMSCLFCWLLLSYEMTLIDTALLCCIIWIMQLGTGKFSLWLWDDRWVKKYDGSSS